MQALVLDDWWRMSVIEVEAAVPGPGETLLEIMATGICGSDIHGYTGENGRRRPGQIMGHETVGRVVAHGPGAASDAPAVGSVVTVNPVVGCGECATCADGIEQWCPSRTVIGVTPEMPAAFAQRMTAPTRNLVPIPATVPWQLGALVEPLSVGYHAATRGRCGPDDAVLVIGGGPIGQACFLAARRLGCATLAVSEINPARRELLQQLGAQVIDPTTEDLAGGVTALFGRRPSLVLDAVGAESTVRLALDVSGLGARVVLVGMAQPQLSLSAYQVSTEERTVIGSFCYTDAEFRDTADWVGTDPDLLRLIDGHVDLDGAPTVFEALAKGDQNASKVFVYPNGRLGQPA